MKGKLIINRAGGFSTLEIIIAEAIMILALTGMALVIFGSQSIAVDSELGMEAISQAQNLLETSRALALEDFNAVMPIPETVDNIFTKRLDVQTLPDFRTKLITAEVKWQGQNKTIQSVELSSLITDWANPTGSTCDSDVSGDWSRPQILNANSVNLDGSSTLTGVDVNAGIAYLTANSATKSKNDFYTVDVSNPQKPSILAGLNTGPGLAAVYVAGQYAYAANTSLNAQLQIIDISQPKNPVLLGVPPNYGYKLPGDYKDDTTVGNSIFYYRGRVFLGTQKSQIEEFHIINVTDPNNPYEEGSWEIGNAVNAIYVKGNYAYLATPNSDQLIILDISDPANPKRAGGVSLPDSAAHGKSLAISDGTLYLGRTKGLPTSTKEFYSLDISNPALDPLPILSSQKINDSVNNLLVRDNLAILALNNQLQIWSLAASKIGNLTAQITLPSASTGMDCEGNIVYLGTSGIAGNPSQDVLKIIGPGQ